MLTKVLIFGQQMLPKWIFVITLICNTPYMIQSERSKWHEDVYCRNYLTIGTFPRLRTNIWNWQGKPSAYIFNAWLMPNKNLTRGTHFVRFIDRTVNSTSFSFLILICGPTKYQFGQHMLTRCWPVVKKSNVGLFWTFFIFDLSLYL